jgi:hypothetical protein
MQTLWIHLDFDDAHTNSLGDVECGGRGWRPLASGGVHGLSPVVFHAGEQGDFLFVG